MKNLCSIAISLAALLILVPSLQVQVPADWKVIGQPRSWVDTIAMTGMDDLIWSVEADGTLFKNDPKSGHYEQVGPKGLFGQASMLEGLDGALYTVEGGTLYRTSTKAGSWQQVGKKGDWAKTVAAVGMNGYLWSIEEDGTLFRTETNGHYEQIGPRSEFRHATLLAAMDGRLWTVENGTLHATDPARGIWQTVGEPGEWAKPSR